MGVVFRWKRKDGGTGTVLSTVDLGEDGTADVAAESFRPLADQQLRKFDVRVHYFPVVGTHGGERANCVKYLDDLKAQILFKPPVVKPMARGAVRVPNIFNNFGDLGYEEDGGAFTVLLDNCCLFDATIVDDSTASGLTLSLIFGRASNAAG